MTFHFNIYLNIFLIRKKKKKPSSSAQMLYMWAGAIILTHSSSPRLQVKSHLIDSDLKIIKVEEDDLDWQRSKEMQTTEKEPGGGGTRGWLWVGSLDWQFTRLTALGCGLADSGFMGSQAAFGERRGGGKSKGTLGWPWSRLPAVLTPRGREPPSYHICFMLLWQERIWNSAYSLGPHLSKETSKG